MDRGPLAPAPHRSQEDILTGCCTNADMFKGTNADMFKGTNADLFKGTNADTVIKRTNAENL
jgi:hypothetical protein